MTENVNDDGFDDLVKSNPLVIVDFWAEWCGPCHMVSPVLEQIEKEMEGKIKVAKMNIDENKKTPVKFGIMSIPTLLVFKDGKMADRMVGALPKEVISGRLEKLLE